MQSTLITLAVLLAASFGYVATISHAGQISLRPAAMAVAATLFGALPPLAFGSVLSNAAARQLAVVAWRMAIMLPALFIMNKFDGMERICFIRCLLACYFVALLLESGLLIRDARRTGE
ncbi:MAG: hypothetical protein R3C53_25560 [Pirellulaceae bacterium]